MTIDAFDKLSINPEASRRIDGRSIAEEILTNLKAATRSNRFLAVFLVGDDPASVSFVRQKEKTARELGIDFRLYQFSETVKQDELRVAVRKTAAHKTCGGIIVQLPLPEKINAQYVLNAMPREKDVDVLGERALGAFYVNRNPVLPPACGTVLEILKYVLKKESPQALREALGGEASLVPEGVASRESKTVSTAGAEERLVLEKLAATRVAVVGLGPLVGKPVSLWLERKCRDLYLLRRGSDFSVLKQADLVITGVGRSGLIKPEMLKENVTVIDFGYDFKDGKIFGDFDGSKVENSESKILYTPTPGGTGPILVAEVFRNFVSLTELSKTGNISFGPSNQED